MPEAKERNWIREGAILLSEQYGILPNAPQPLFNQQIMKTIVELHEQCCSLEEDLDNMRRAWIAQCTNEAVMHNRIYEQLKSIIEPYYEGDKEHRVTPAFMREMTDNFNALAMAIMRNKLALQVMTEIRKAEGKDE